MLDCGRIGPFPGRLFRVKASTVPLKKPNDLIVLGDSGGSVDCDIRRRKAESAGGISGKAGYLIQLPYVQTDSAAEVGIFRTKNSIFLRGTM